MLPKCIGIDTNIFIYYLQAHPSFGIASKTIFESLAQNKTKAVTSTITLAELLAIDAASAHLDMMQKLFLETPNLTIIDMNQPIAIEAARIKRTYGYRLPDAIQLATSIYAKANLFITNDQKIQSCKEITIRKLV